MNISKTTAPSPKGTIDLYTITNGTGASVTLSSLGAGIVSILTPDSKGQLANIVLGYKDPADYLYDGPCAGKIPGRFANRIAHGHFTLEGKDYTLAVNNGPNALHGGPEGFQNQLWQSKTIGTDTVEFTYTSVDGEEGYPAALTATATYTWTDDCQLTLRLQAKTDATTVVNLTNHVYFNLEGENTGSVLGHTMQINASHFLATDPTQIPLPGAPAPVAGTPMDFTSPKTIARDIKADFQPLQIGKGYDHCWVLDNVDGTLRPAATLTAPKSQRKVEVLTTMPGLQIYTGNWLDGSPTTISGGKYHDYDGVAMECQNFPDAPNRPDFPSPVLKKGEQYDQTIQFKFSTF